MDCSIGVLREGDRRIVRLAGQLTIAQVPELLMACDAGSSPLEFDLTDLISADSAAIAALQCARSNGATLVGVPGYLRSRLDSGR